MSASSLDPANEVSTCVGIDFGGVIASSESQSPSAPSSSSRRGKEDTQGFFGPNYLEVPPVPGCFAGIALLVKHLGSEHVYIVSKAGLKVATRSQEWLAHHGFFEATGFRKENVLFCRERPEKAGLAAQFRMTHFIDDTLENLQQVSATPHMAATFLYVPPSRPFHWSSRTFGGVPCRAIASWRDFIAATLPLLPLSPEDLPELPLVIAPPQPCKYFAAGRCRHGEACKMSHSEAPAPQASSAIHSSPQESGATHSSPQESGPSHSSPSKSSKPCSHFLRGHCKHGHACRYIH